MGMGYFDIEINPCADTYSNVVLLFGMDAYLPIRVKRLFSIVGGMVPRRTRLSRGGEYEYVRTVCVIAREGRLHNRLADDNTHANLVVVRTRNRAPGLSLPRVCP